MIFKPRPYQLLMYQHLILYKRASLMVPMGMGKTSATLMALSNLQLIEDNKVLVLAPLRVARSVWPAEVEKWDDFKHLKIVPICGNDKERKAALNESADIHTMNYENLPWLVEQNTWPWRTVVADESTRLKSFRLRQGSKRAKALARAAWSRVDRFIELTGTPAPNGLKDLWGQLWFLDNGERLGKTYTSFTERWFRPKHFGSPELVPLPNAQQEIQNKIKDICMSLRVNDWFSVQEPIITDVPVTMPPAAYKLYKQMEKELFIEVKNKPIEALNAASKSQKCLQLASGAIYVNEQKDWEEVHTCKLDALESILEEANGMPILVAYHFKSDLARLKKRFPQGKELDKATSTIDRWNNGEIPILFAHPQSAGHGLNLQYGGNIVVFFSHWWDLEYYQQILERIGPVRQLQAGFDRPVFIYNIRTVNTIDALVIRSRTEKATVQDLLLEAAKKT